MPLVVFPHRLIKKQAVGLIFANLHKGETEDAKFRGEKSPGGIRGSQFYQGTTD
jgi:hypothetical protein